MCFKLKGFQSLTFSHGVRIEFVPSMTWFYMALLVDWELCGYLKLLIWVYVQILVSPLTRALETLQGAFPSAQVGLLNSH